MPVTRKPTGGPRVLVVEDDENIRHFVRLILEEEGYAVSEAADGEEAIDAIRKRPHDAILLDLMMPKVDGFGVLEAMAQMPSRAATPVVVVTARHDPSGVLRTIGSGATDHIAKPFSSADLTRAVERAISGEGVEDRRGALWRSAQVYEAADALQAAATNAPAEPAAARRFGRRR